MGYNENVWFWLNESKGKMKATIILSNPSNEKLSLKKQNLT